MASAVERTNNAVKEAAPGAERFAEAAGKAADALTTATQAGRTQSAGGVDVGVANSSPHAGANGPRAMDTHLFNVSHNSAWGGLRRSRNRGGGSGDGSGGGGRVGHGGFLRFGEFVDPSDGDFRFARNHVPLQMPAPRITPSGRPPGQQINPTGGTSGPTNPTNIGLSATTTAINKSSEAIVGEVRALRNDMVKILGRNLTDWRANGGL